MHGSPDGPWFFIIARNDPDEQELQLIGITDTSMLRPQVFALQDGEVQIGLICSEKQAIDATLDSLSPRKTPASAPWPTSTGTPAAAAPPTAAPSSFTVEPSNGGRVLSCHDKFGKPKTVPRHQRPWNGTMSEINLEADSEAVRLVSAGLTDPTAANISTRAIRERAATIYATFREFLAAVSDQAAAERRPQGRGHQRPDPAVGPPLRPGRQEAQQPSTSASWRP